MSVEKEEKQEEKKAESPKPTPQDVLVESKHTVTIGDKELAYTVTTGTIVLKEEGEREKESEGHKPKAAMFFTAYTLDGVDDKTKRPLTFSSTPSRV